MRTSLTTAAHASPTRRHEVIAADLISLPATADGFVAALTMQDAFTRYTRAWPLKYTDAATVAMVMLNEWIWVFGVPDLIITDNGSSFAARSQSVLSSALGSYHFLTSAGRSC